ncbi:MAG: recombination protein RecO [Campylobacterota bacterium]|nr:recombination protein RecO [Campylobacterota bacterium]
MKGFILRIQPVKDEDCIVTILSYDRVASYYRFYGARHSVIALGFLIDYEIEGEDGKFLPRLRGVSHMGFDWQKSNAKVLLWHQFIRPLSIHLKDVEEVDAFYYNLLLKAAQKINRQNPKRVLVESYLELLEFEGRIYDDDSCYICQGKLGYQVSLMQSFKLTHPECIFSTHIHKKSMVEAFESKSTIHMDDIEVDYLFGVMQRGL